jgi:hypothetical protein
MAMDQNEWQEFIDTVKANAREHAGYFAWKSDKRVEEVGVVQSLHESLAHSGQGFFHSYQSRGRGNDPPDCEAFSNAGERIAIEVTELVDGGSIAAGKSGHRTPWEPFAKDQVHGLLTAVITKKDNPSEVKGGPYPQYVLVIYCDEPRVLHYDLIEYVRGAKFPGTKLIDRVFLFFSYSPWEESCPYIELQLSGVSLPAAVDARNSGVLCCLHVKGAPPSRLVRGYAMLALLRTIFLGLSVLFGVLAAAFMIYVLVVNPKGFFQNLLNPLWIVYFLPSAACYRVAEWINGLKQPKDG